MVTIPSMSGPLSPTPDEPEVGDEIQLLGDGDGEVIFRPGPCRRLAL